jgi:hypothetical protein
MAQREPKSGSLKRSHAILTTGEQSYSVEVPNEILEDMGIKDATHGTSEPNAIENTGNYSNSRRRLNSSVAVPTAPPTSSQSISTSSRPQDDNNGQVGARQRAPASLQNVLLPNNRDDEQLKEQINEYIVDKGVVRELLSSIKLLIKKQEDIEAQNNLVAEWRLVAQVVDRILFWVFFTFTFTSSAIILVILPIYKRGFGQETLFSDDNSTDGSI